MNEAGKRVIKAVAYYRVSTDRQGKSGLGLEAQKEAVHAYKRSAKIKIIKEYIEVESSKKKNRPVLQEALNFCQTHNTLLIIAKLDRLGRNVAFISALMESKVRFVATDNPEANKLIKHILAAVAQYEREQISLRTKAALQAAKKRGVILGKNGRVLAEKNKKSSSEFSRKLQPIITRIISEGFTSIQSITDELNNRKIETFRTGSRWHKSTVHNLLKKIMSGKKT